MANLGPNERHAQARMDKHVTKVTSLNTFYIKNISWKFHWNLMNQIEDLLSHVHFGPDSPNCPAPFCPFRPFSQEPDFSQACGFRRMIHNNNIFHFKQKKYTSMDKIFIKNEKTPFLSHFGPFWALFAQIWSNGIFLKKLGAVTFERLWTTNFMQKIRKN